MSKSNAKYPQIVVLNRVEAETFTGDEPYAVISICNPGDFLPEIPPSSNLQAVLRLEFHDLTTQIGKGGYTLFSPGMAKQIFNFILEHSIGLKMLVVHCGMGRSRSAAVAAGLCEYIHADAGLFVRGKNYNPNPLVLALMRDEAKRHREI